MAEAPQTKDVICTPITAKRSDPMKKHRFLAAFTACTLLALTAFGSFTEAAAADSRTAALTTQAESYFNFHKDTQHWVKQRHTSAQKNLSPMLCSIL